MAAADVPDQRQDRETVATSFAGAFTVRMATPRNQVIAATVTPLGLSTGSTEVSAVVGWEGIDAVSSILRIKLEPAACSLASPWVGFLELLWAALGPDTVPEPSAMGAGAWSSIVLSTQELDGALEHSVLVVVDNIRGEATLVRSDPTRRGGRQPLPESLRKADAGTALVQMSSLLLLGRPWK